MASGKWVAYYRVSTAKQGASGLGLEAQREAVAGHLNGGNWQLAAEFVEIESGKRNDRPELAKGFCQRSRQQVSPVPSRSRCAVKRLPRCPARPRFSGERAACGDRR